jgi:hypothetical protein
MSAIAPLPAEKRTSGAPELSQKRDEIGMNHHRALGCCLSMIFSENRYALFRIMPWR